MPSIDGMGRPILIPTSITPPRPSTTPIFIPGLTLPQWIIPTPTKFTPTSGEESPTTTLRTQNSSPGTDVDSNQENQLGDDTSTEISEMDDKCAWDFDGEWSPSHVWLEEWATIGKGRNPPPKGAYDENWDWHDEFSWIAYWDTPQIGMIEAEMEDAQGEDDEEREGSDNAFYSGPPMICDHEAPLQHGNLLSMSGGIQYPIPVHYSQGHSEIYDNPNDDYPKPHSTPTRNPEVQGGFTMG